MIRAVLIAVCLAAAWGSRAAESPPLETRVYRPSSTCPLFPLSGTDGVTNLQALFKQEGIVFGSGATVVAYDRPGPVVAMRNTSAEHAKLGLLLQRLDPNTPQIVADFVVVEFRADELAGGASTNLMALWQSGKGSRVAAAKVVVKSGVNANVLDSREEHDPEPADSSNLPPLLTPGTFDTREVGLFGSFTPELRPDSTSISLYLSIGWSWHSGTNLLNVQFGGEGTRLVSGRPSVMQPLDNGVVWFTPDDGETFVLGAPEIPGESAQPYLFATFHIIDAAGRTPGTTPVETIAIDGPTVFSGSSPR